MSERAYEIAEAVQRNLDELDRRYILHMRKVGAIHGLIVGCIWIFIIWGIRRWM